MVTSLVCQKVVRRILHLRPCRVVTSLRAKQSSEGALGRWRLARGGVRLLFPLRRGAPRERACPACLLLVELAQLIGGSSNRRKASRVSKVSVVLCCAPLCRTLHPRHPRHPMSAGRSASGMYTSSASCRCQPELPTFHNFSQLRRHPKASESLPTRSQTTLSTLLRKVGILWAARSTERMSSSRSPQNVGQPPEDWAYNLRTSTWP